MKKLFTVALAAALLLANVADAKFSDEYKAKYPTRVKTTTKQDLTGKVTTTTEYNLFYLDGFKLVVKDSPDYKYAYVWYHYLDKPMAFFNRFSWGDGATMHNLPLFIEPVRGVVGGKISEVIMAEVNPTELKKALIIHAHSHQRAPIVMISSTDPEWPQWKAAVEDAEKLLQDK